MFLLGALQVLPDVSTERYMASFVLRLPHKKAFLTVELKLMAKAAKSVLSGAVQKVDCCLIFSNALGDRGTMLCGDLFQNCNKHVNIVHE